MARSPRWSKVVRDLTGHPARTALVILSIAVGVFAVSVVLGARQVLIREFEVDFVSSVPASAEFDTTDFDEDVLARIDARDDVRAVEGRRRVTGRYTSGTGAAKDADGDRNLDWQTMRLWALPSFDDARVQRIVREQGSSWPPGAGEVVLERGALQLHPFEVGDVVTFESASGARVALRVVGLAHDINAIPAQFQHALTGYVSPETLPLLEEADSLNHIAVVFDPGISRSAAARTAADIRDGELKAEGVTVHRMSVPEPGSHFLGDIFKAISLLLLAMGVMALALSAFLVVTTVSAIMSQQVRQVGIMKAIGGRRGQVMGMYLALVFAYGIVAVIVGLAAGLFASKGFIEYAAGVLNFRIADFMPPFWVSAVVVAVGLIVPVIAAVGPVRRGSELPVARALNAGGPSATFGHGLVDRALGLLRGLPRPVALSLRNTFLRKGRLALTLTTLVLASAVVMAVLSVRTSVLTTVDDMGSWWHYDAQVFFGRPAPADEVEREAADLNGVAATETWLESSASLTRPDRTKNEDVHVIGLPPETDFVTPRIESGRWLSSDGGDEIVLNSDVMNSEKYLSVGDTVRVTIRGTEREFELVGVASGQMMGPVAFVDRERLDAVLGADGAVSRVLVRITGGNGDAQARAARQLEDRLSRVGMPVSGSQTFAAQSETIENQLGILVTFLVIMASLLAAVGVIGLTGTMTINVLESTREIGVMRSIGASHGWVFYIFITEGVVIALISWALGAVLSWPFSLWLVSALSGAMNLRLSYEFSFVGVALWFLLMIVIASIASVLPAWRASQVSIRDAIAYE